MKVLKFNESVIHAVFQNNTLFKFIIKFIYLAREPKILRKQLKEKELHTDENCLQNKMAKDCGHQTKETCLLQSQVLQARRQLDKSSPLLKEVHSA